MLYLLYIKFTNMFGYRLIKNEEIENLKSELVDAKEKVAEQSRHIAKLLTTIKEQDSIIANLTLVTKDDSDITEEKPIKKVRRKNSKRTVKKDN